MLNKLDAYPQQIIESNEIPDYYHLMPHYSDDVWTSSEAMKYIVQLDSDLQAYLYAYYNPYIYLINQLNEQHFLFMSDSLKDCYLNYNDLTNAQKQLCKYDYYYFLNEESDMAYEVNEYSNNLLDKFHPTKDRLNNLLLRLIMGKDAVEALVTE